MKIIFFGLLTFAAAGTMALSQIIDVNFTGGGPTSYSAWSNVNAFNYFGYGSFPGNQPWPAPIEATEGSVSAILNRISGAPSGGGPFLASESIYFGSFQQIPNSLGGILRLSESDPLFNLRTLVFQIQIGEATGFDFYTPAGYPTLSINGEVIINATYTNLVNRYQSGFFPSPDTGKDEPVYINTWAYQWNITPPVVFEDYSIDFSAVTHSQVYALRLDGTSVIQNTPVIPEPSSLNLVLITILGLIGYRVIKTYILR